MPTDTDLARLDVDGRVATLTLDRPDKRNALSPELISALRQHVDALAGRDDLTVLVLQGAGKAFCAGMDLRAVLHEPGAPLRLLTAIAELTIALRSLPLVVVAKVQGAAIGGGCGLVAVADLAVTHPEAKLGYPEVDLGVCPAVVAPWLVRAVGGGAARRILLRGGTMSGQEAHESGLVSDLVPREALAAHVEELAGRLAAAGAEALRRTKLLLNDLDGERTIELVRRGAEISAEVVAGPEAQERLARVYGAGAADS